MTQTIPPAVVPTGPVDLTPAEMTDINRSILNCYTAWKKFLKECVRIGQGVATDEYWMLKAIWDQAETALASRYSRFGPRLIAEVERRRTPEIGSPAFDATLVDAEWLTKEIEQIGWVVAADYSSFSGLHVGCSVSAVKQCCGKGVYEWNVLVWSNVVDGKGWQATNTRATRGWLLATLRIAAEEYAAKSIAQHTAEK